MHVRLSLILLLLCCVRGLQAQLTYQNLLVEYDSAMEYKNLKLIPIRYKGPPGSQAPATRNLITFNEALRQGLVTVQERGTAAVENVHWLSMYNNSGKNVLVSSGEVLAGGRQDRVVSKDTIVAAKSGRIDLPVMCVEEGRWSEKDKKFEYSRMANTHLRKTIDQSHNQVLIWKEINNQLERDKVKNKTLSYLSREKDKNFTLKQSDYWQYFDRRFRATDSTIVGIVCMSGDSILGSDIFAASNLFYGKLQPMLMGYIEEAMVFGGTPAVPNTAVKKYLDQFLIDEVQQEAFVKKNGKLFKAGGKVIHITTY